MAYCGPRAIPLTAFLAWDPSDQEAALSWQGYEARRCSGCGHHPDEPPRHPHVDVCPGCVVVERTRKGEDAQVSGAHVHMAHGLMTACDRCTAQIEANRRG